MGSIFPSTPSWTHHLWGRTGFQWKEPGQVCGAEWSFGSSGIQMDLPRAQSENGHMYVCTIYMGATVTRMMKCGSETSPCVFPGRSRWEWARDSHHFFAMEAHSQKGCIQMELFRLIVFLIFVDMKWTHTDCSSSMVNRYQLLWQVWHCNEMHSKAHFFAHLFRCFLSICMLWRLKGPWKCWYLCVISKEAHGIGWCSHIWHSIM